MAKAQRNDAAAVAKAAKAVDRSAIASVLRDLLAQRLPKVRHLPPRVPMGNDAPPIGAPESAFGDDGELRVGRPTPMPRSRRTATRVDYATKQLVVTKTAFGRWPRYGTKRYAKAEAVRQKLQLFADNGDVCKVRNLLGLPYDSGDAGKPGSITYHDLQVMEEKRLITIQKTGE